MIITVLTGVAVRTILLRQNAGGGSTITQQLAKNLYPRQGNGSGNLVAAKIREMISAHRMERVLSKQEILELYLKTVSFGEDTLGLEMASNRFFSTSPSDLPQRIPPPRQTTWSFELEPFPMNYRQERKARNASSKYSILTTINLQIE